jgi:uncharacterized protein (DUF2336 family)
MSEPSPAVRADLAGKLAADLSGEGLTDSEVKMAHDIVRILAHDVEEGVRASLSRALRHSSKLPRDVALKLAHDIEFVALPMLADCLILTDDDLAEIVQHGSSLKQEAVASRPDLTETVSDMLTTYGAESAVTVLMSNNAAKIAEGSFNHAMTRFAGSKQVTEAMALREILPAAVVAQLITIVSKALQAHLVKAHDLPPKTAADIVRASQEYAIIHLSLGASDRDLHLMVTQMHNSGRLTPSLILRALCTGDIAFFEAALAVRGDVPLQNAQILIHDPSRLGLTALYRKAAMPTALLGLVQAGVAMIDDIRFDRQPRDPQRLRSRVISGVVKFIDDGKPLEADYLLNKLEDALGH